MGWRLIHNHLPGDASGRPLTSHYSGTIVTIARHPDVTYVRGKLVEVSYWFRVTAVLESGSVLVTVRRLPAASY